MDLKYNRVYTEANRQGGRYGHGKSCASGIICGAATGD